MPTASRLTRLLLLLGGAAAIGIIGWAGAAAIGREVFRAGWAIPATLLLHAVQLFISGEAWRVVTEADRPGVLHWWRIRWIREAINSMLPVAQIGGNIAGVRLLEQAGLPIARAGAGTVLDITAEAASQAIFTLAGIAVAATLIADHSWLPLLSGSVALLIAGVAGFILAQRFGLLRVIEAIAGKFGGDALRGLHEETMRLARHRRGFILSTAWHLLAWAIGVGETYLALYAMGAAPLMAAAFVIESLGMAARSVGFAVPGALGVQEAGFVAVAALFGIPAETAIALSMVKRVREVTVGVGGLLAWQWSGVRGTRARVARSDL